LFGFIEDLLEQQLDGLWLSCKKADLSGERVLHAIRLTSSDCKSNMAIIGSFIITALLSSADDEVYQARHSILDGFRNLMYRLVDRFEFAALPLLRLNLLVKRFAENDLGGGSSR
jgi:hypothetical protein